MRHVQRAAVFHYDGISIHAPARGATSRSISLPKRSIFQSTHPRGVRPKRHCARRYGIRNFNPRTREGCDIRGHGAISAETTFQSTHPRGVRHNVLPRPRRTAAISIHAPARGATGSQRQTTAPVIFQSTHPRGVRHTRARGNLCRDDISIHAPARGATDIDDITDGDGTLFQSTHPRGVRPFVFALTAEVGHFNPRTREGCDALSTGTRFST